MKPVPPSKAVAMVQRLIKQEKPFAIVPLDEAKAAPVHCIEHKPYKIAESRYAKPK